MAPSNALSAKGTLVREGLGVAVVLVVSVGSGCRWVGGGSVAGVARAGWSGRRGWKWMG